MKAGKPFWGRATEIEKLSVRLGGKRSAILIHGDPQIGKTSLIERLASRVRAMPTDSHLVGLYSAIATPHDPFVFAIADLVSELYRAKSLKHQLATLRKRLREAFSPDKLKEFCAALWQVASDSIGLNPAKEVFHWLIGEAKGLDLSVKTPMLSAHEAKRVLQTILHACPELHLVLIVDNFSSTFELPSGLPGWDYGTLLHLLSEELPHVHLIITWKDSPSTAAEFERLRSVFLQHGGETIRLGPMDADDLREWARTELPELSALMGEDSLIELMEGLPKIPSELRVSPRMGREEAVVLATQIKRGSYDYLHAFLKSTDAFDRDCLLYLCIDPLPLQAEELADVLGADIKEVVRVLKSATDRNLLCEIYSGLFIFEHDVKRRVVFDHLAKFHGAGIYLKRALTVLETQIYSLSLGSQLRCCRVARLAVLANAFVPNANTIAQFYIHWMGHIQQSPVAARLDLLEDLILQKTFAERPLNIQACVLMELFALAVENRASPFPLKKVTAETMITLCENAAPESKVLLTIIHAAMHAAGHAAITGDNESLNRFLEVVSKWTDDGRVASEETVAIGQMLTNMTITGASSTNLRRAVTIARKLKCDRLEPDLRVSYAQTLVNLVRAVGGDIQWLEEILEEARNLIRVGPLSVALREACMRCFHDLAVSLDQCNRRERIGELLTLATDTIGTDANEELLTWYARLLSNATAYFGRDKLYSDAFSALDLLSGVADEWAGNDEIASSCALACSNVAELALVQGDSERAGRTLQALQQWADRNPKVIISPIAYAGALADLAQLHKERGDWVSLQEAVRRLSEFEHEQTDIEITRVYASSLWASMEMTAERRQPGPPEHEWFWFLYDEACKLADRCPGDLEVCRTVLIVLGNMALLAGVRNDWRWLAELTERATTIASHHSTNEDCALHVGRAYAFACFTARNAGEKSVASGFEDAVRRQSDAVRASHDEFKARFESLEGNS